MLVLDVLDNMPHLRLSDDHMKSVLWMLKELNVPGTPSFYALRETQKRLAEEMDIQPRKHVSALGKEFHAVAPEDLLALVGIVFHWTRVSHSHITGLGQPTRTKVDASVSGGHNLH